MRLLRPLLAGFVVATVEACSAVTPSATYWNRPACEWDNGGRLELEQQRTEDFCRPGMGWIVRLNGKF